METEKIADRIDQNDRIMAGLAHIAAILPVAGVIAPVLIWVTQRDESEFVAFQALQAIAYQITMFLGWFLGMGCYMCSFFAIFIGLPFTASSDGFPYAIFGTFLPFIVFGLLMFGVMLFTLYGVLAAIMVIQGKDFRYIIIGNWLEKYLSGSDSGS